MVDDGEVRQNYETSHQTQSASFLGVVRGKRTAEDGKTQVLIEMRNRFKVGDTIEVLSPTIAFNKKLVVVAMEDQNGNEVTDAKNVQQKLYVTLEPIEDKTKTKNSIEAILEGDIIRTI